MLGVAAQHGYACLFWRLPVELYIEGSDYKERWQVAADASTMAINGFFGVEIITSILYTDRPWENQLNLFWYTLTDSFEVRGDPSCGTHIHFSPVGGFTLAQLKKLTAFVTIFQPAITALIPSGRRGTDWCHANAEVAEGLRAKYMAGRPVLLAWIEGFSDKSELWENISPNKTVAWNFRNAREGGCGTVEFRQPPGVVSNAATKRWVAIALALFAAGIEPWLAYPVAAPTVEDLKIVLEHSASRIGVSHLLSFDGESEQTIPINTLSAEEREYITLLKAQKPSIFAENLERRGGRGSSP
ncbi:hypothetical protein H112_08960 [Trichophyton rubrum D6]|nr:hypothetical protein H102_08941 [Trichophyton rubrum CBS 100081]EZF68448.1 hypothetical protein H105_08969 [Trichophyton soudanense CBS 452.61]EZF89767.1 hypothetical protein H113_09029 [Trichophyton rubrum MR1459]EZG11347.1 hypothetical protein H107_09121 [Trichophyton rubrum CBS 202.88]KDB28340.1 hypothetical protein H112_08960 [Trichophyton rubrum D6]